VNVENACAGASTSFAQAGTAIRAGDVRVVLAVGFEKMFVDHTGRSLDALESAADLEIIAGLGLQFTAIYAMRVRARLAAGAFDPRHLLDVTVKSHHNGALNPNAQHRTEVTAKEVAESRPIAEPLTLLMCSSICDGAAAAVLVADDHPAAQAHPQVVIRASALASGYAHVTPEDPSIVSLCAEQAYAQAGIEPTDLDVAEVHDAMAPGELLYYEQLGFCAPGEAGQLLDSGATQIGGRLPVNPSGGLCSRGHPVGATGLAQIAEVVWQLRGEAGPRQAAGQPRLGLTQNSGGWLEGDPAAIAIHVLERTDPWH
jgi:acetyl-CoA acetyltransferase